MCSFLFQSHPTMWCPSSLSLLARCDAMKPPAPVTQIFSFFSGQYFSVPYFPRSCRLSYPAAAIGGVVVVS
jgi:hypothetical protein|tara:strand:+ start:2239 stop:2451 length:213 start_codon:yes stop_codon:yes gene_type:complete